MKNKEILMHNEEGERVLDVHKEVRKGRGRRRGARGTREVRERYASREVLRDARGETFPQYIITHQEADVKENRLGIAHQKVREGRERGARYASR